MNVGMDRPTALAVASLSAALNRQAEAANRLAAAIEAANSQRDFQMNGPRG
ncbi:hypothetical protein ACQ856_18140 [Mycolicibacterium psychrotolerans]|uniref:hypothetical protein n=1 Tax=Mycolicibacterium psychrotolerans TaxID=216929 RepID=UPI003D67CB88